MTKHHHLVVGGGFAGLRVSRLLSARDDVRVTLVTPHNNFEYHGSLYRSANGTSPLETVIPYREILAGSNIEWIQDFMVDIDMQRRRIRLLNRADMVSFDSISLCLGYEAEYFGIPGMREFSSTLYTLADALTLRKRLRQAAIESYSHERPAQIVIVGGGPTGVEVAAAIPKFFELLTGDRRVDLTLVEHAGSLLPSFPADMQRQVAAELRHQNIRFEYQASVIRASNDMLHIADKPPIQFDVLIWTAGSGANSYFRQRRDMFECDGKGRVVVNNHLETRHDMVYVLGDSASIPTAGTAHAALDMGEYVAGDIAARLDGHRRKTYHPKPAPYAVPTSDLTAVAFVDDTYYSGAAGWIKRRQLDLTALEALMPHDIAKRHWQQGDQLAQFLGKTHHS